MIEYSLYDKNTVRMTTGLDLVPKGFSDEELGRVYMRLFADPADPDGLVLEDADFNTIDRYYNPGEIVPDHILEAVTAKFSRLVPRMKFMAKKIESHMKEGIKVATDESGEYLINDGEPPKTRKVKGIPTVTGMIRFTDGQSVTMVFHAPEGGGGKIDGNDQIVAFRFLLNRKDITQIIAKGGMTVSANEIAKKIAQVAGKNSEAFQKKQRSVNDLKDATENARKQAAELAAKNTGLEEKRFDTETEVLRLEKYRDTLKDKLEKAIAYNDSLRKQIAGVGGKKTGKAEAEPAPADDAPTDTGIPSTDYSPDMNAKNAMATFRHRLESGEVGGAEFSSSYEGGGISPDRLLFFNGVKGKDRITIAVLPHVVTPKEKSPTVEVYKMKIKPGTPESAYYNGEFDSAVGPYMSGQEFKKVFTKKLGKTNIASMLKLVESGERQQKTNLNKLVADLEPWDGAGAGGDTEAEDVTVTPEETEKREETMETQPEVIEPEKAEVPEPEAEREIPVLPEIPGIEYITSPDATKRQYKNETGTLKVTVWDGFSDGKKFTVSVKDRRYDGDPRRSYYEEFDTAEEANNRAFEILKTAEVKRVKPEPEAAEGESFLVMDNKSNVKMRIDKVARGYEVYDNKNQFIKGITKNQFQALVQNAKKEGLKVKETLGQNVISDPPAAAEPETAEPEAVSTLNDILSGKYDDDILSGKVRASDLSEQTLDSLEDAGLFDQYEELWTAADDYTTKVSKKRIAA